MAATDTVVAMAATDAVDTMVAVVAVGVVAATAAQSGSEGHAECGDPVHSCERAAIRDD